MLEGKNRTENGVLFDGRWRDEIGNEEGVAAADGKGRFSSASGVDETPFFHVMNGSTNRPEKRKKRTQTEQKKLPLFNGLFFPLLLVSSTAFIWIYVVHFFAVPRRRLKLLSCCHFLFFFSSCFVALLNRKHFFVFTPAFFELWTFWLFLFVASFLLRRRYWWWRRCQKAYSEEKRPCFNGYSLREQCKKVSFLSSSSFNLCRKLLHESLAWFWRRRRHYVVFHKATKPRNNSLE